jgi:cyclic pyranopterin phosphate synthase
VRQDLTEIIAAVADAGVGKIALTTNGWTLARRIEAWAGAGLTHLNVSIDSLDQKTFAAITGHDRLAQVLDGVERATQSGLQTKLNAVLLRDTLGNGFEEFAKFIQFRPLSVRFIELMRTGDNADYFQARHVRGSTLCDWLGARGWSPVSRAADSGPAIEYAHPDYLGRFGIIAPYAPGFCDSCNRLRVTARGRLRLCLFGEGGVDLRDLLRSDGQTDALIERVGAALSGKVRGHGLANGQYGDTRQLAEVGG